MKKIRTAIVGVGNCAASLVQGIHYYANAKNRGLPDWDVGLAHPMIGKYGIEDIEVVAAIDIDSRKVGRPLHEALFARPNCTKVFYDDFEYADTKVAMGRVLDGVSEHLNEYPESLRFSVCHEKEASKEDIKRILAESGAEILVNYLPVGSQLATEFYVECCLETGVSLINCIPVFIVSDSKWSHRFREAGIPCVGDDVKAQVGATITHRQLASMLAHRGARIDATYQLNIGGNTDFLNMLDRGRIGSKRVSKTRSVTSQVRTRLEDGQIHIGPSDFVEWQKDNKVCYCRIQARGFGAVPLELEVRLSVEDSPNSAGIVVDAIRCCKVARDRELSGPIESISAFAMKHPPRQMSDDEANVELREFIERNVAVRS